VFFILCFSYDCTVLTLFFLIITAHTTDNGLLIHLSTEAPVILVRITILSVVII
jgi:hypothetical protein